MSIEESPSDYTIDDALEGHTLSERYFFGYTTSRRLLSRLDEIVVEPYSSPRDEYVYFRNHNIRAWVDGTTKHVEVPSELLAQQVAKVHRQIGRSNQFDFEVDNRVDASGESIYETTDRMLGAEIDDFFDDLDPAGHVVLCRPEEVLVELLEDSLDEADDFLDDYIESSSKYLRRTDDVNVDWTDAHEPHVGMHPKFRRVDEMLATVRKQTGADLEMATATNGVFRGYRLDVNGRTLTLLCRGWGRDMTYAMTSRLLEHTTPDSVLFMGGCGAVHPELELNEFVVPDAVDAPGEPEIAIDNAYLHDEWVREVVDGRSLRGTAYNVNSPVDETTDYMLELREADKRCVSMENYGVAKALESTDVPFGVLLFVMDCPLRGIDLGSTNYDPQKRSDLTFVGNAIASKLIVGWHGLLDRSTADLRAEH